MTLRGRVLVALAFVLSAGLFATAAVALVLASRDHRTDSHGSRTIPSLLFPTSPPTTEPPVTPSPTHSPAASPAASPTPSPAPSPTAAAAGSPAPRATASRAPSTSQPPPPVEEKPGLFVDAVLDPANGDTVAGETVFTLFAHATDGDGTISLQSVAWGDGTTSTIANKQTDCASTGTGDCKDFEIRHTYGRTGRFEVYLTVVSGPKAEKQVLHITAFVNHPKPTPSPSATP